MYTIPPMERSVLAQLGKNRHRSANMRKPCWPTNEDSQEASHSPLGQIKTIIKSRNYIKYIASAIQTKARCRVTQRYTSLRCPKLTTMTSSTSRQEFVTWSRNSWSPSKKWPRPTKKPTSSSGTTTIASWRESTSWSTTLWSRSGSWTRPSSGQEWNYPHYPRLSKRFSVCSL